MFFNRKNLTNFSWKNKNNYPSNSEETNNKEEFIPSFVINNGKRKSSNYVKVGIPDTGSQLNIHPIAFSSSIADKNKITYIYRSGLGMEERI